MNPKILQFDEVSVERAIDALHDRRELALVVQQLRQDLSILHPHIHVIDKARIIRDVRQNFQRKFNKISRNPHQFQDSVFEIFSCDTLLVHVLFLPHNAHGALPSAEPIYKH